MDPYAAAMAFVREELEIEGDIFAAIRFFVDRKQLSISSIWHSLAARFGHKSDPRADIEFHYDRSNDFYAQFLDSRMQYSEGNFSDAPDSLEQAQVAKLEQICRDLKLASGDTFLDVGCGWGGLVVYAAERFGVNALGCTLSPSQHRFALDLVKGRGLENRASILLTDYHSVRGRFTKIASVGMFEHVGRKHLREYFDRIYSLLEDDGIFLNRGIVRPETVSDGPETLFLQRNIFPGGELEHLSEVIHEAGAAGFEVQHTRDFRQDYSLTCKAWVERLQRNAAACCAHAGKTCYRAWLLYLAASSIFFEEGITDAVQVVLTKSPLRRF